MFIGKLTSPEKCGGREIAEICFASSELCCGLVWSIDTYSWIFVSVLCRFRYEARNKKKEEKEAAVYEAMQRLERQKSKDAEAVGSQEQKAAEKV